MEEVTDHAIDFDFILLAYLLTHPTTYAGV